MTRLAVGVILLLLSLTGIVSTGINAAGDVLLLPSEARRFFHPADDDEVQGTRWAVLIAGSNGYENYRHQADVCHAHQLLKKGGLKDENIIVFMYDDIASNEENPHKGIIINNPNGSDVYSGVPKDYTGNNVTVQNFLAAILGNKTAITGGSGKVVNSGPNDHIFIYYTDHGGAGVLGMPTGPLLYANELIDTLKTKHASGTYKSLVFYLEACESGSIFQNLLPEGLNVYATTAANATEDSWATYCPGQSPSPPPEYNVCLGDLYSVAWIEDSEVHDRRTETLQEQYEVVKTRTLNSGSEYGSHVMQYGDMALSKDHLCLYMGAADSFTFVDDRESLQLPTKAINQRDADLVHFWDKYRKAPEGSVRKVEAQKKLVEAMSHRMHVDKSVELIGKLLFGTERGPKILKALRPAGQPLVDDWKCLKKMVRTFETQCGSLAQYGRKHMRSFANICNAGIQTEMMAEAAAQACVSIPYGHWISIQKGYFSA